MVFNFLFDHNNWFGFRFVKFSTRPEKDLKGGRGPLALDNNTSFKYQSHNIV